MNRRTILLPLAAAAAFAVALAIDRPVNDAVVAWDTRAWVSYGPLQWLLRAPGNLWALVPTMLLLTLLHRRSWRPAGLLAVAAVVAGTIAGILKGLAGRARPGKFPDDPGWVFLRGGWHGFWHQTNVSFVSGDVTQAFAWAAALAVSVPRLAWPAYGWASLTAVQRVASGAHWPSDCVGGAVVGVVTVRVGLRILSAVVPPAKEGPAEPDPRASADAAPECPLAEPPLMTERPMPENDPPYLSLVIPCYNEQENVPTLLGRVEASMNQLGRSFEVILVDDGSTDDTPRMLAEAQARLPWLRVLRMNKNSGQSAGFEAGFAAARGRYIATIDADLQNDPEEVPRLAKLLDETPDADMITGWRKDRQDTDFRRWQSRQANKIRNWISQDNINDSACSLKIYKAETVKGLKLFNGAHRFFPALVKMRGFRVIEVPVKHSHRFAGTAKYGFRNRALRAFIDLLGVRWMKMRYLRYAADEVRGRATTTEATATGVTPHDTASRGAGV